MIVSPAAKDGPDYGLDSPKVVRNLFLIGGSGILVAAIGAVGLALGRSSGLALLSMGLSWGLAFLATGLAMVWRAKVGKLRMRERLLDLIAWRGDEQVLDIGCGRGLMLVGAARRLTRGRAVGIDLWRSEDLAGNRPEATLENARREGVAGRVEVMTADMRQLPFPDASIDVVVSTAAIHNLDEAKEREDALCEIARVVKPGGVVLIEDIRHYRQYASVLEQHGFPGVRQVGSRWVTLLLAGITLGQFRPATLFARKSMT